MRSMWEEGSSTKGAAAGVDAQPHHTNYLPAPPVLVGGLRLTVIMPLAMATVWMVGAPGALQIGQEKAATTKQMSRCTMQR